MEQPELEEVPLDPSWLNARASDTVGEGMKKELLAQARGWVEQTKQALENRQERRRDCGCGGIGHLKGQPNSFQGLPMCTTLTSRLLSCSVSILIETRHVFVVMGIDAIEHLGRLRIGSLWLLPYSLFVSFHTLTRQLKRGLAIDGEFEIHQLELHFTPLPRCHHVSHSCSYRLPTST